MSQIKQQQILINLTIPKPIVEIYKNPLSKSQFQSRKDNTELSIRLSGKENYLDYTFLSHRSTLSSQFEKKKNAKEYLFDLQNTLEINLNILKSIFNSWKSEIEKEELMNLLKKINQNYSDKKQKEVIVNKRLAKILMDKQIIEEIRRSIKENNTFHLEKEKENKENINGKEEYRKKFEKKLIEVEVFIQKNTKQSSDSKYEKFKEWKMTDFLWINHNLIENKNKMKKDIEEFKKQLIEVIEENTNKTKVFNDFNSKEDKKKKSKEIISELRFYYLHTKRLQTKVEHLRKLMNSLSFKNLLHHPHNNNNTPITNEEYNDKNREINEEENKSLITSNMNKKLNALMDFSYVLNKKMDDTQFEDNGKTSFANLGNVTNLNMWDLSCINK